MITAMRAFLVLALALSPVKASAQDRAPVYSRYAEVSGWIITRRAHDCSMGMAYDTRQGLSLRLDQRLGRAALIISDPSFRSLVQGREYSLDLWFQKGKALRRTLPEVTFMPLLGEEPRAVAAVFDAYDILPHLAANDALIAFRGTAVVARLSLSGSAPAIVSLRSCASAVAQENPSDPFAEGTDQEE